MIREIIMARGQEHIHATQDDPHVVEVAALAEKLISEILATGASAHTCIVVLSSAIGYSIGNGARGGDQEAVMASVGAAQTAMIYSAFDAFESRVPAGETVQ